MLEDAAVQKEQETQKAANKMPEPPVNAPSGSGRENCTMTEINAARHPQDKCKEGGEGGGSGNSPVTVMLPQCEGIYVPGTDPTIRTETQG